MDHWLTTGRGSTSARVIFEEGTTSSDAGTSAGRPTKDWPSLSKQSKQRKVQTLLQEREPSELFFAASQGTYGKNPDLGYVLQFTVMSPTKPMKLRKLISNPKTVLEQFTQMRRLLF